jgi:hypothetical protein
LRGAALDVTFGAAVCRTVAVFVVFDDPVAASVERDLAHLAAAQQLKGHDRKYAA